MSTPPAKLRREWAEKLRASGFEDLESDPEGPLSDRGNLHPVTRQPEEWRRLGERIEDGEAYQAWARNVLHGTRWKSSRERRIWEMHCDGAGDRAIAAELTAANPERSVASWRHEVQRVIGTTKAKAEQRWETEKRKAAEVAKWPWRAQLERQRAALRETRKLSAEELQSMLVRLSRQQSSTE